MKDFIAAAGRCTLRQDLNKVLLDLGGQILLGNFLNHFARAAITDALAVAGFDAALVRKSCAGVQPASSIPSASIMASTNH